MVTAVTVVTAVTEVMEDFTVVAVVTEASTAATVVVDRGVTAIGTDRIAGNMAAVQAITNIENRMIRGRIPRILVNRDRRRLTLSCTSRKG